MKSFAFILIKSLKQIIVTKISFMLISLVDIFVTASHQARHDSRSMTRRSIKVRIRWPSWGRGPYGLKSAFVGLRICRREAPPKKEVSSVRWKTASDAEFLVFEIREMWSTLHCQCYKLTFDNRLVWIS